MPIMVPVKACKELILIQTIVDTDLVCSHLLCVFGVVTTERIIFICLYSMIGCLLFEEFLYKTYGYILKD